MSDYWELFLVIAAFAAAVATSTLLAILGQIEVGIGAGVIVILAVVSAIVVAGLRDSASSLALKRRNLDRLAGEQLGRRHRSVVLAQATSPSHALFLRRALTEPCGGRRPGLREAGTSDVLMCPVEAPASDDLIRELVAVPSTVRVAHGSLIVVRGRDAVQAVREDDVRLDRARRLMATAASMIVAVSVAVVAFALPVAQYESASCAPGPCDGVPNSYGDAVYWLVSRVMGGDPDGVGAGSAQGRFVGVGFSIIGLILLTGVVAGAAAALVTALEGRGNDLARQLDGRESRYRGRATRPVRVLHGARRTRRTTRRRSDTRAPDLHPRAGPTPRGG